ncbi:hypothetical protein AALO_G00132750 [Alosa alosa]|uniref:Uncharacterized protein n=1 Tax=Alosa alosa TaxID=278164 RepID=A0AAV6GMR3_9TELE|nr:hypothetical protein AALO_G00132750 [Alosa alosa]
MNNTDDDLSRSTENVPKRDNQMFCKLVLKPIMTSTDHTPQGNSTGSSSVPLIVGLSVGLPLAILTSAAVVLAIVWCHFRSSQCEAAGPREDAPKVVQDYPPVIQDYPPVAAFTYPPAPSEHIYENYQAGGPSPHVGTGLQPPVSASGGQRSPFFGRQSPRQVDPGDTGIYANVPSTFPSRT